MTTAETVKMIATNNKVQSALEKMRMKLRSIARWK
jgi:hypothetical protein